METPMCECAAFHSSHLDGCPVQHEIDRLRKENVDLREHAGFCAALWKEYADRISELEADLIASEQRAEVQEQRIAELEADARRYRRVRDRLIFDIDAKAQRIAELEAALNHYLPLLNTVIAERDAAIDAATSGREG